MATKPTIADAAWATDTNYSGASISGVDGSPTKVSAGAGVKAQGWRPGDALGFVGDWFNYWMNQVYLWCTYLGDLHNSADFLNKAYAWVGAHSFEAGSSITLASTTELEYFSARSRTHQIPFGWENNVAGAQFFLTNDGALFMGDISQSYKQAFRIPEGATLTRVRLVLKQDTVPLVTNTVVNVYQNTPDWTAPYGFPTNSTLATMTATNSTTAQLLDSGALSATNTGSTFLVNITTSDQCATDKMYSLEITFTETRASGSR